MKNYMSDKNSKIKRPVKKLDIHACVFCPGSKKVGRVLWLCESKNKHLDFMAVKKNVIPDWCPLEDY